jgi:hypothetical protein
MRADRKRVQDLYQLSAQINLYWKAKNKLPDSIDEVQGPVPSTADPITRAPYEYLAREGSHYDLCATFYLDSKHQVRPYPAAAGARVWAHPPGHHCFSLDATITVENPYSYYPE